MHCLPVGDRSSAARPITFDVTGTGPLHADKCPDGGPPFLYNPAIVTARFTTRSTGSAAQAGSHCDLHRYGLSTTLAGGAQREPRSCGELARDTAPGRPEFPRQPVRMMAGVGTDYLTVRVAVSGVTLIGRAMGCSVERPVALAFLSLSLTLAMWRETAGEGRLVISLPGGMPLPTLPAAMLSLLAPFAPCCSPRVWSHALVRVGGTLRTPGRRTVTTARRAMGRDHCRRLGRDHRVLNRDRWSSVAVSRTPLRLLVATCAADGPRVLGIAETIARRRGATIAATGIDRAPVRASQSQFVQARGRRGVCLLLLVPIPWAART